MKKKFYITFSAFFVIIVLLVTVFFWILWEQIFPNIEELEALARRIDIDNQHIQNYERQIARDLVTHKQSLEDFKSLFLRPLADNDLEGLRRPVVFLQKIAERNHLLLTLPKSPPTILKPDITLSIDGEFMDIVKFLRELENESLLLSIRNVHFRKDGANIHADIDITFGVGSI